MKAAVVGLGKIGLPIATQIALSGVPVTGGDISQHVVDLVNAGTPPFPGEAELDTKLQEAVDSGLLSAVADNAAAAAGADAIIIVVPMYVDQDGVPDFSILESASRDVGSVLRAGQIVIYETTLPVGATRHRLAPVLEAASGLEAGSDFHVVHSPERVFSGRIFSDLRRYPKLVGGMTETCAQKAVEFYERILQFDERPDLPKPNGVWNLHSLEAAEMAKLAETTYRDVNIALANEFATFAEKQGLDVHAVIEAANSQPFSHIHRPGVYVGGHCIPVYPRFYSSVDPDARLPRLARQVNDSMPRIAVQRLVEEIGELDGKTVAVFGAAYRGGVKETAFSGVFPVVDALRAEGAVVRVEDPLYTDDELEAMGFTPHHRGEPADAIVVQADHPEYRVLTDADLGGAKIVYDGRRVLDSDSVDSTLLVIGRGTR